MRLHIVDLSPADLLAGIVLSGAGEILDYTHDVRVWYRVLPGGVPGVLTGTYPGGFRYPFGIVPGVTCGKRLFRAKGRCGSGAGGYGDMGREEIRRLCLNVWASPAVSPGGRAGCMPDLWSPPGPLPIWSHPPGCMSRAAAPYPFRGGNIEGRPAGGGSGFFPGRPARVGLRSGIRARCAGG